MSGPIVLVLAAGLGTRMKSGRAKVLHQVAGRPLLCWAVESAREAGASRVIAILGHQIDEVRRTLEARYGEGAVEIAHQAEQKGTGHAVQCALPALAGEPDDRIVVITSGDVPLLLPSRIAELARAAADCAAGMALLSMRLERAAGYGRLVRDAAGKLLRIVEHKDASEAERAIAEVNAGVYAVALGHLRQGMANLSANNAQGELYLTDLAAAARGGAAVLDAPFTELSGINDRCDLAAVDAVACRRINERLMRAGVTLLFPDSVRIEAEVTAIGGDTVIGPHVVIAGRSRIGSRVTIEPGCVIMDCDIGDDVHLLPYTVLRGTTVERGVTMGSFVEVRQARVLADAQVGQLSYVGHATVGAGAILGAGMITCDFDGQVTAQTTIEAGAFVGSQSQLVAPVTVGRESYVAAGTTVTRDVTRGALALARTKQVNVEGWAERFREAHEKRKRT